MLPTHTAQRELASTLDVFCASNERNRRAIEISREALISAAARPVLTLSRRRPRGSTRGSNSADLPAARSCRAFAGSAGVVSAMKPEADTGAVGGMLHRMAQRHAQVKSRKEQRIFAREARVKAEHLERKRRETELVRGRRVRSEEMSRQCDSWATRVARLRRTGKSSEAHDTVGRDAACAEQIDRTLSGAVCAGGYSADGVDEASVTFDAGPHRDAACAENDFYCVPSAAEEAEKADTKQTCSVKYKYGFTKSMDGMDDDDETDSEGS